MGTNIGILIASILYSLFSIYRIKNNSMTPKGWVFFVMFIISGIGAIVGLIIGVSLTDM